MKRILSIGLALLLMAALLAGCGANPVGKYVLKTVNGQSAEAFIADFARENSESVQDVLDYYGLSSVEKMMTLTLNKDGSFLFTMVGEGDQTGAWKQSGDTISCTNASGHTEAFTLKGSEISISMNGLDFVLVKK